MMIVNIDDFWFVVEWRLLKFFFDYIDGGFFSEEIYCCN